ncbi:MAG: PAS domain-containing protein [Planctomycetes bacterium]|nr:PAS domain-containing protein [Planctomycetota bacterium]
MSDARGTPGSATSAESAAQAGTFVVGIGASAGGLEALEAFVAAIVPPFDAAIVVHPHLSPDFESRIEALLAERTSLPVHRAEDGAVLRSGGIHVVPPRKTLAVRAGRLHVADVGDRRGPGLPIDAFMSSLAEDAGERAIAIVLSGAGDDGSRGVRAVKERGGLVLVQREDDATFPDMPRSALDTGCVDLVLLPAEMPAQIQAFVRTVRCAAERGGSSAAPQGGWSAADEGETAALRELLRTARDGVLRVWVAGSSTGQEVFALAMRLEDELRQRFGDSRRAGGPAGPQLDYEIVATHRDPNVLLRISEGRIEVGSAAALELRRLARHAVQVGDALVVDRSLRDRITFAVHDPIADLPFARIDLIVLRSPLAGQGTAERRQLVANLGASLRTGALLQLEPGVLSEAELLPSFGPVDGAPGLYRRSATPVATAPASRQQGAAATRSPTPGTGIALERVCRAMLQATARIALVIDARLEVSWALGDTSSLLGPREPDGALDLAQLLDDRARATVSTAVIRASLDELRIVDCGAVPLRDGSGHPRVDDVRVLAVRGAPGEAARYLLLIGRSGPAASDPSTAATSTAAAPERELRARFDATVEELQSANEELQTSNEQLLAANEELQSTNEELHSVNDQLFAVNAEQRDETSRLTQAVAELQDALAASGVALLVLDDQRRIVHFTQALTQFVRVVARDVGRPLDHLAHDFGELDLGALADRVLTEEIPLDQVVTTRGGHRVRLRVLPHQRGLDERRGVVLTAVEVADRQPGA